MIYKQEFRDFSVVKNIAIRQKPRNSCLYIILVYWQRVETLLLVTHP